MPLFTYSARDSQGQLVAETIAFNNELALREHLRKNELFVVQVQEQRRTLDIGFGAGIGLRDLIVVVRQLRTMMTAGVPLVTGLDALARQSTKPRLTAVLNQIARAVGHGQSLAAVLREYPKTFPEMLVALIAAGEESGRMPEALTEAGRQLELQLEIRQKMISAMVYPCFALAATFGVLIFMLLWIVPVFSGIYKELNAPLPAITLSLIWASDLLIYQGWVAIILVVAAGLGLRQYRGTPSGRLRLDALRLKVPILGNLHLKSASAALTGTLAGLVESGVPLIQALQTAANTCGNEVLADAVRDAARRVVLGNRLSDELERTGHFPVVILRMMAIAEDVGSLPQVLREIAAAYIEEVDYTVRRAVGVMEPALILCVGAVVGYVLLALYYPIFSLGNAVLKSGG